MTAPGGSRRWWARHKRKLALAAAAAAAVGAATGIIRTPNACGCTTPVYGDVTPPAVSITAPSALATVSGATTAVTATATDNVSVTSVQFKLDGVNLGAADTTNPYGITWNTTTASDAVHVLTAVAVDAAANTTTSASVSVTVSNGGAAPTANLWVDPSGSSACTRGAATTFALAAGHICWNATASSILQTAMAASASGGGDTVRVTCATGTLGTQTISTSTHTGATTFRPETDLCATIEPQPVTAGTATSLSGSNRGVDATNGKPTLVVGGAKWVTIEYFNLNNYQTNCPETTVNGTQTIGSGGTLNVASTAGFNGTVANYSNVAYTFSGKTGTTLTGVTPGGTFTNGVSIGDENAPGSSAQTYCQNDYTVITDLNGSGNYAASNHISLLNNQIDVGKVMGGSRPINVHLAQDWLIDGNTIGPACCGSSVPGSPVDLTSGRQNTTNTTVNGTQTIGSGGTLTVTATSSAWSSSGTVYIGNDPFTYTGKTGTTLTGVTPGGTFTTGTTVAEQDCSVETCNLTFTHNLVQYADSIFSTDWPASGFGSSPDITCTNTTLCHYDVAQITACITCTISYNQTSGDACTIYELQPGTGGILKDITMVGNTSGVISHQCNGFISLDCHGSSIGCAGTWNIGFNESRAQMYAVLDNTSLATGTIWNVYGNYLAFTRNTRTSGGSILSASACDFSGTAVGAISNLTANYEYNVWRSGSACVGSDTTGTTPSFVNDAAAPIAGLDLHKTGALGTADNFVVCASLVFGSCPATDYDGNAFAATADAGADQR